MYEFVLCKLSLFRIIQQLKDLWYYICQNRGNSNKPSSKSNLDVLTVSLFYVICCVGCLAGLICDCAALVLAVVFYCFHQQKLSLYDLSKWCTLISEGSKESKGNEWEMRETKEWAQRGEDITANKERKNVKKRERIQGRMKNKNERNKKENKDRWERVRCGPFISRLLQGILGQHTCYYSLQRK